MSLEKDTLRDGAEVDIGLLGVRCKEGVEKLLAGVTCNDNEGDKDELDKLGVEDAAKDLFGVMFRDNDGEDVDDKLKNWLRLGEADCNGFNLIEHLAICRF